MKDYKRAIAAYIDREAEILKKIDVESLNQALNLLEEAFEKERTIYIFGNGGSAATASHYQNDFNKGVSEHTAKKFRFQCLNDNVATMMAIANDISYDDIFSFQLKGRLQPGDLAFAISGSGNSRNVLKAVEYAKLQGNKVIGATGYDGGKLKQLSDVSLHVPIKSMQITEDLHMVFDHLMMAVFYESMCGIAHIRE